MNILNSVTQMFEVLDENSHIGDGICENVRVLSALRVAGYFIMVAKVFIPFLIILFGSLDMVKVVTQGDSGSVSKTAKSLGIRIVVGIAIFFLPTIIDVILSAVKEYKDINSEFYVCSNCLLKPSTCENGSIPTPDGIGGTSTPGGPVGGGTGGTGGNTGGSSTPKYLPSGGSCSPLSPNSECTQYSGCMVYAKYGSPSCVNKCSTYTDLSTCPSDRCQVRDGQCKSK